MAIRLAGNQNVGMDYDDADEAADQAEANLRLFPPILLLSAAASCWHCKAAFTAVALGAHAIEDDGEAMGEVTETDDMFIIRELDVMPEALLAELTARNPSFRRQHSNTVCGSYYANTCPECDRLTGDFFLHAQPGGAFFPTSTAEAAAIKVERLQFPEPVLVGGTWGYGTGDFILAHAAVVNAP